MNSKSPIANFTLRAILLLLILSTSASASAEKGKRVALVIGVDEYSDLSPLRGASADATRIAQWLSHCGYDTVKLLASSPSGSYPARDDALVAMRGLREEVGNNRVDEVSFFFSGHGFAFGDSQRFCLSDADSAGSGGCLGLYDEILPWMQGFSARLSVAMVDACRGKAVQSVIAQPASFAASGSSLLVLQAAVPGALSRELPDGEGGYFTQTLLESFVATNGTLSSIIDYVVRNLPARTLASIGSAQMPGVGGNFDPSLEFTAARPDSLSALKENGELIVTTQPPGARIWCGSRFLGISPLVWPAAVPGTVRIQARLDGLSAERDVDIVPRALTTVNLLLVQSPGRVFFGTDMRLLEYSVDGGPFTPMNGVSWIAVPPGRRTLRVLAEPFQYWEGTMTIASDRTIQVLPDFVPSGRITVTLPESSLLYLRSADGSRDYLFSESGSVDVLPVGDYHAETESERYVRWEWDFTLSPGDHVSITPPLIATESGRKLIDIQNLEQTLPAHRQLRSALDLGGWFALGSTAILGLAGSFALGNLFSASREYDSAALGADFPRLRSSVLGAQTKAAILFSATAITGISSALLFSFGPHPDKEKRLLDSLRAEYTEGASLYSDRR